MQIEEEKKEDVEEDQDDEYDVESENYTYQENDNQFELAHFKGKPFQVIKESSHCFAVLGLTNKIFAYGKYDPPYSIHICELRKTEPLRTLNGHSAYVHRMIRLESELIASCGSDHTVCIFNWEEGTLIRKIVEANCYHYSNLCRLNDDLLACGGYIKQSLNVFNWRDGTVVKFIPDAHSATHYIFDLLKVNDDLFITAGNDCFLKQWNMSDYFSPKKLKLNLPLCCMEHINDELIAVGGKGMMVYIVKKFELQIKFQFQIWYQSDYIYQLLPLNDDILILPSTYQNKIFIYNWKLKKRLQEIDPGTKFTRGIARLSKKKIITGSLNKICIWK